MNPVGQATTPGPWAQSSTYREHRPPQRLESVIACLWERPPVDAHLQRERLPVDDHRQRERPPVDDHLQRVVPDGCVDLIWSADRGLVVAGADTGPRDVRLPADARSCAVRIRPGSAGAFLGMPASELRDRQVPASDVWGPQIAALSDAMAGADPVRRLALLVDLVVAREVVPDPLVCAAARALADSSARVAQVAAELSVSERTLHRRMLASVGYGPKMLARVGRMRRLIALGDEPLAARAFAAGYASQAHMTEEVRRLTGSTPVRFLKDATLTAA